MNMIDLLNARKGSLFTNSENLEFLILIQTEGNGIEVGVIYYDQYGDAETFLVTRTEFEISFIGDIFRLMKKRLSKLDIMNFIFHKENHHKPHRLDALYKSARLSSSH